MQYLTALRPINLLIIAATQLGLYYKLFISALSIEELVLAPPNIFLFTIVTVLIAASGYLINDYFDFESDLSNKKQGRLVNKSKILPYYLTLVIIGFFISLWLAHMLGNLLLALIYLAAIALLYAYAVRFKKNGLSGNLLVAGFTSGVLLILLFAERTHPNISEELIQDLMVFSGFIFLINLIRELIKDVEDIDGDHKASYMTVPIAHGIKRTYQVVSLLAAVASILVSVWVMGFSQRTFQLFGIIGVVIPLIVIAIQSGFNKFSPNPSRLSLLSKSVMVLGLGLILLK